MPHDGERRPEGQEPKIPAKWKESLQEYIDHGKEPSPAPLIWALEGSVASLMRDSYDTEFPYMWALGLYLYDWVPPAARGSQSAYTSWRDSGGRKGQQEAKKEKPPPTRKKRESKKPQTQMILENVTADLKEKEEPKPETAPMPESEYLRLQQKEKDPNADWGL